MLLKTALFFWYNNWKRHLFLSNSLYHIPPKKFCSRRWQECMLSYRLADLSQESKYEASESIKQKNHFSCFLREIMFADQLKFSLLKKIRILQSKIQLFHLYDPNENKSTSKYEASESIKQKNHFSCFLREIMFADQLKFSLLKKIRILQSKIQLFHLYDPNENKSMIKYFFADNKSYYPNLDDSSKPNFGLRSGRAKNSVVTMKVIVQGTLGVLFPATALIV